MKVSALLFGRQVQIVQSVRNGSDIYIDFIDSATGDGPYVSTKFSTSASSQPDIVVSTSAHWVA